MKIDPMTSYPVYRKNSEAASPKTTAAAENTGKTDVADFSYGQTAAQDKALLSIKSSVLSDIARATPRQDLAELRESIREGSYRRSTDEIVDAILGGM